MQTNNEVINTPNQEINKIPLVHTLEQKKSPINIQYVLAAVIILSGIGSGFLLSKVIPSNQTAQQSMKNVSDPNQKDPKITNTASNQVFSDSAQGELKENTSKNEGSFLLVRPGGDSQTVYLTSSVLDLSTFVGKKVKVWGQTFAAKKAGWLMDVGKIEEIQ